MKAGSRYMPGAILPARRASFQRIPAVQGAACVIAGLVMVLWGGLVAPASATDAWSSSGYRAPEKWRGADNAWPSRKSDRLPAWPGRKRANSGSGRQWGSSSAIGEDDARKDSSNPWARRPSRAVGQGSQGQRPWGEVPDSRTRRPGNHAGSNARWIDYGQRSAVMPPTAPYAGPAYLAPYYTGPGYPYGYGAPILNDGLSGNAFPWSWGGFPFSFW